MAGENPRKGGTGRGRKRGTFWWKNQGAILLRGGKRGEKRKVIGEEKGSIKGGD